MPRIPFPCLLALFSALLSPLSVATEERLVSLVSDTWAPYVTANPERPGVDVEVAVAVLEGMGHRVNFRLVPWKRAQQMVIEGDADGLIDISKNSSRLDQYWFPDEPLSYSVTTLVCRLCDRSAPLSADLFEGQMLVVNRGYAYAGSFDEDPAIQRIQVNSIEAGLEMLQRGRADYYLINRYVALYHLRELGITDIGPMSTNLNQPSPLYLAFARTPELEPLAREFSEALARFKQSPRFREIHQSYGLLD